MKRLPMLCAIALMGSAMAIGQDQTPQRPADNTTRTEPYGTRGDRGGSGNWGWLGLLGLLGLTGLRRGGERTNRTYYEDTRRDDNIGRRAA
jgi:MYXO-CTERM domain-containing protein